MKSVSNNIEVKIANAEKIYAVLRGSGGMTKSQLANSVGHQSRICAQRWNSPGW